ncbi:hypothetical protein BJL95_07745 [Methylomonas sp. LWB]|uniref:cytochrome ubiquinol oxidase subunit I n=1 Tax=Methylomonas sp. LWB TaxID=1905845 RepID=UPI0008DA45E3|nr:cytochrome ubiquinol oxidase subunit I [Methylomonas sp. LWB]OHX36787.1 hypothetical protein BJL95_07745 [Methylomonas sp. LWB]
MISETVIELSRGQFAMTATQHFLFMPVSLGLSLTLAVLETLSARDARYAALAAFWGKLFGIGFTLTAATTLILLCQFGSHWSYFAHYAGDAIGLALLTACAGFFATAQAIGRMLFGGQYLPGMRRALLAWTACLGCHVALLGFVLANAWMQYPLGSDFNPQTFRLELTDPASLFRNPVLTAKFLHAALAGYATAAGLMLAVSASWLRHGRDHAVAATAYRLSGVMGLTAVLAAMAVGDTSIFQPTSPQAGKFAAIHGLSPDELIAEHDQRIRNGVNAYEMLQAIRDDKREPQLLADFAAAKADLGHALLLKRWKDGVSGASEAQIQQTARASVPPPEPIRWGYRIMVGCGVLLTLNFLAGIAFAFGWLGSPAILKAHLYALPLPWLASGAGWFIAEYGRQPWLVADALPIWLGVSLGNPNDLWTGLGLYALAYGSLLSLGLILANRAVAAGLGAISEEIRHGA